jgi:hypothetical protein
MTDAASLIVGWIGLSVIVGLFVAAMISLGERPAQ